MSDFRPLKTHKHSNVSSTICQKFTNKCVSLIMRPKTRIFTLISLDSLLKMCSVGLFTCETRPCHWVCYCCSVAAVPLSTTRWNPYTNQLCVIQSQHIKGKVSHTWGIICTSLEVLLLKIIKTIKTKIQIKTLKWIKTINKCYGFQSNSVTHTKTGGSDVQQKWTQAQLCRSCTWSFMHSCSDGQSELRYPPVPVLMMVSNNGGNHGLVLFIILLYCFYYFQQQNILPSPGVNNFYRAKDHFMSTNLFES